MKDVVGAGGSAMHDMASFGQCDEPLSVSSVANRSANKHPTDFLSNELISSGLVYVLVSP